MKLQKLAKKSRKYTCKEIMSILACWMIITLLSSCDDAEQFKQTLDDLPQINSTSTYKYKSAYGVGDTLTITGFLYPEKGLKITVGGVEAPVFKRKDIEVKSSAGETYTLNQVSFVITEKMGIGSNRSVLVNTAGNTVQGASIEIYEIGGKGSFSAPLGLEEIIKFNTNRRQNVYLHCINGTGSIYYFDYVSKDLRRLRKGETEPEIILTATQLKTDQNGSFTLSKFLAGGINPQETKAWISVQTSTSTEVSFAEIDLENKTLERLNISTSIATPYTGNIGEVNMKASGIFPDSQGNVYLWIGSTSSAPQDLSAASRASAVAKYDSGTRRLEYIFRTKNADSSYPGVMLPLSKTSVPFSMYIAPDEALLYVFYQNTVNYLYNTADIPSQAVINLNSKAAVMIFTPTNFVYEYTSYLGPFSNIKIAYDFVQGATYYPNAGRNFGFMPLPDMRFLILWYQKTLLTSGFPSSSFPKWLVADFKEKKMYQYHTGRFEQKDYTLSDNSTGRPDQVLNYDDEGHLYMTASERQVLVKTIAK